MKFFNEKLLAKLGMWAGIVMLLIALYQVKESSDILSTSLVADKVEEIVYLINHTRIEFVALYPTLCKQNKLNQFAIENVALEYHKLAGQLIARIHNFKKRLGKKNSDELRCYAQFHVILFFSQKNNSYCYIPTDYQPTACSNVIKNYTSSCYKAYTTNNDMKEWGFCVSDAVTEEAEKRYRINLS